MSSAAGSVEFEPPIPLRVAARLISELNEPRVIRWQAAFGLDRVDQLVFQVTGSANLAHLPLSAPPGAEPAWRGLEAPEALFRPVRISAVAHSMSLPNETVRRRMIALQKGGLVRISDQGCAVAPGVFTTERMGELWRDDAVGLAESCRQMAAAGYALAAEAAPRVQAPDAASRVARLLLDFGSRAMESFIDVYGDLMDGALLVSLISANVRNIAADPELSARYAHHEQPPPDHLRQPLTVSALAREMRLPYETVRRRCVDLVARGEMAAAKGGLIVPAARLQTEVHRRNNLRLLQLMNRMLREAATLG